jgi:hypothetical protein
VVESIIETLRQREEALFAVFRKAKESLEPRE